MKPINKRSLMDKDDFINYMIKNYPALIKRLTDKFDKERAEVK